MSNDQNFWGEIDLGNDRLYNKNEVAALVGFLMNLQNPICTRELNSEGGFNLPQKIRHKIMLSDGRQYDLIGNDMSQAIEVLLNNITAESKTVTPVFEDYVKEWLELYHYPNVGASWKRETDLLMSKHIMPYFCKMELGDIKMNDVQRFFNTKAGLSESTNKHIKYLLSGIFQSAVEDGYMDRDFTKSPRLTISHRKEEREPLTLDEVQDVLSHLDQLNQQEQRLIMLLLFTGMRRGELLGLRWGDVDLVNEKIYVRRSVAFPDGNNPVLKDPKSKAGKREIPIVPELKPFLIEKNKNVFVIGEKDSPLTARAYGWMFDQIEKKIDMHGATAHSLRHTFATLSSEHLDPKTLQYIMGHSKMDITMNRYTHVQERLVDAAGTKLVNMYGTTATNDQRNVV